MRAARILNLEPYLERYPARAVGRAAPARRDGTRDRARPEGVPVRRAAVEPRRQAARGDARGDQGAAPAAQDDDRLRHARPGRGDDDGRPHRRHARRRDRADRHAARALRPARQPVRRAIHRFAGDERGPTARCDATGDAAHVETADGVRWPLGSGAGVDGQAVAYGVRPDHLDARRRRRARGSGRNRRRRADRRRRPSWSCRSATRR